MYKSRITKEELNTFETVCFDGEVVVVDTPQKIRPALEYLREYNVVGIDTETRPSFAKGIHYPVALLQVSTLTRCFLFRLNKIGLTDDLAAFLSDKQIKKIGLSLRDDLGALLRRHKFQQDNFVDIQNIVCNYGILDLALQKIFGIVFRKKISKTQQLTNWENDVLTEQQQYYAATDAWATLLIYEQLSRSEKLPRETVQKLLDEDNVQHV